MTSKVVVQGLKIIGGAIDTLLLGIPSQINAALKSPLAKNILGRWGNKISGFISNFTSRIKQLLGALTGKLGKEGAEGLTKSAVKQTAKPTLTNITKKSLTNFFRITPKISKGSFVLRKLGFVVGKPYKYVSKSGKAMTATIKEITDNGVKVAFKNGTTIMIPVETFIKNAVGAPWMRRGYSVMVPLFIKRFSDFILPDGNIDYVKIEQLPGLDPNTTSQESMEYLQEEVASYEGDTGNYSVNTNVSTIQNALLKLGFKLPRFGADGKFGPETQEALKQFQDQNKLTSSSGKIDRLTARKLSELLKSKNIPDSEQLINSLNNI
jgi:hypothetical protein